MSGFVKRLNAPMNGLNREHQTKLKDLADDLMFEKSSSFLRLSFWKSFCQVVPPSNWKEEKYVTHFFIKKRFKLFDEIGV